MNVRGRLLGAFIGIALFGLMLVGLVIYDSSVKFHAQSERYILESFSKPVITRLTATPDSLSDLKVIDSILGDLAIDNLQIFLKDKTGRLYFTHNNKQHDDIYTLKFIKELIEQDKNNGHAHKEGKGYSWLETRIPNSQYTLILVRKRNNITSFEEYYSTFGNSLLFSGIIVLWISVWGGLITGALFRKVEKQKTDLYKQADELELAKDQALSASKAKSIFLSSMSHEIRTPLNAILGFAQLLRMSIEDAAPEHQLENINEIENAGGHLLNLINDALDLEKIESGHIDIVMEPVRIDKILYSCEHLIDPLIKKYRLTLNYRNNLNTTLVVRADHLRLKQALLNLLSNACKYNKPGGSITIDCDITDDGLVRISIADTGKGLEKEKQSGLFTAFNRLGAEQTEIEGTGIGLVITKQLIELMGGSIGVESEPGKGSTFWVELNQEKNLQPPANDVEIIQDEERVLNEINQRQSVLYIDDIPSNIRLVKQLLNKRPNIIFFSAHEPEHGLVLVNNQKFDLILLDINMHAMNGYEILKRLKGYGITRDTPVIAISANVTPQDKERGIKAGFTDYLTKPIDVAAFFRTIDRNLS